MLELNRFQSTHSRGVRQLKIRPLCFYSKFQSTHSRGVRHPLAYLLPYRLSFQSTHSRGVRPTSNHLQLCTILFQSTHSRGVRHLSINNTGIVRHFNPRTREECDNVKPTQDMLPDCISIHALARSATTPK